jgi:hypothetical protein
VLRYCSRTSWATEAGHASGPRGEGALLCRREEKGGNKVGCTLGHWVRASRARGERGGPRLQDGPLGEREGGDVVEMG